jgi:hypothetical protein
MLEEQSIAVKASPVTTNKSKLKKLEIKKARQNVAFAKKAMYRCQAKILAVDQKQKVAAIKMATITELKYKQTMTDYPNNVLSYKKFIMRKRQKAEIDEFPSLASSSIPVRKPSYASIVVPETVPTNVLTNEFTGKIVLFNFCNNKAEYLDKCRPIIVNMVKRDLIAQFGMLCRNNIHTLRANFKLDDFEFTDYDFDQISLCKPLIAMILQGTILTPDNVNMIQLTKLVSKKYIIMRQPTMKKIVVNVVVDNRQEIKVIAYNTITKGQYKFNDPKGSIEHGEHEVDALLREMKEELGFTFTIDRYKIQFERKYKIKYILNLTINEINTHFANLDTSILDPEITHIVLQDIVNK